MVQVSTLAAVACFAVLLPTSLAFSCCPQTQSMASDDWNCMSYGVQTKGCCKGGILAEQMQQSCRCTKSQSCPVELKDAGESCSANSDCKKPASCKGNVCCNLADDACLKCSPSGGKCAECDSNTHCLSSGKCYKKADEECQPKIENCATNVREMFLFLSTPRQWL